MPIYNGNQKIDELYYGSNPISLGYYGNTLVYQKQIQTELLLYAPFDNNIIDAKGNYTLTRMNGDSGFVNGKLANTQAIYFMGDYLTCNINTSVHKYYALCFWVYILSGYTSGQQRYKGMFGQYTFTNDTGFWRNDFNNLQQTNGQSGNLTAITSLTYNTWHHIFIVRNSSEQFVYINGTKISRTPSTLLPVSSNGNLVTIGGDSYDPITRNLRGYMQELAFWSGGNIDDNDILYLYNNGIGRQVSTIF